MLTIDVFGRQVRHFLLVVCLLAGIPAVPTEAACDNARLVTTSLSHFTYFVSPGLGTARSASGNFWGLGHGDPTVGAGDDNGGDLPSGNADSKIDWLRRTKRGLYIAGAWSNAGIDGCVDDEPCPTSTVLALSDEDAGGGTGFFVASCVQADAGFNYDFSWSGRDMRLVEIPRARATGVVRGDAGELAIQLLGPTQAQVSPGLAPGWNCSAEGLVIGYRVYYMRLAVGQPPPQDRRRSSGWQPGSAATPLGEPSSLTLPCDAGCALYLATSLVFDSGFETSHLSPDFAICPGLQDDDLDGFAAEAGCGRIDCDDQRAEVHPGAEEACNGLDDDCDGSTDEAPASCDDHNPCTDDSCAGSSGCRHTNNAVACDAGAACASGGRCREGACEGGVALDCDDHDACTEDTCDPLTIRCVHVGVQCNDCNPCTADVCDPGTGCVHSDNTRACDDGNACTADACDPTLGCAHTEIPPGNPCDDHNSCTVGDTCDEKGICVPHELLNCDDGVVCTTDFCSPTAGCLHNQRNCNDPNPCTDDSCDPVAGCVHAPNTAGCDDGNRCTTADRCENGTCLSGEPTDCGDVDPCTTDGCDPSAGCIHTPRSCDDGQVCTSDACEQATGECIHAPLDCDDGDVCTTDSCAPSSALTARLGMAASPRIAGCVHVPMSCDDRVPCTLDYCDPTHGCLHTRLAPGEGCDDGNACTLPDTCNEKGTCTSGPARDCDDANACTSDRCDVAVGCLHAPVDSGLACDDQDPCTTADACNGTGQCVGGPPALCDDNDACTSDSCNRSGGGCLHAPRDCSDGDACTFDTCASSIGCVHAPIPGCGGCIQIPSTQAYGFNEGAGTILNDVSALSYDGALTNGPTWTEGKHGSALAFDGSASYVSFENLFDDLTPPFTVEAWVYPQGTNGNELTVFATDDGSVYAGIDVYLEGSDLTVAVDLGDGAGTGAAHRRSKHGSSSLAQNAWTHIAVVVRGTLDIAVYVNGVEDGGYYDGYGGPMIHNTNPARVGKWKNSYFIGRIDELRVYGRAFTAAEVLADMNAPM